MKSLSMGIIKFKIAATTGAIALLVSAFTTPAIAVDWGSVGFGASFGGAHAEAVGKETGAKTDESATEDSQTALAAAHVQITLGDHWFGKGNGFAFGVEHFFGEANFKNSNQTVTDMKGSATGVLVTGTNHAEAVLKNMNTVFVETPGLTPLGIFLKAGWSEMDIETNEELFTGGSYGNASVDGAMVGFGFKKSAGHFQIKSEFNYTDWDSITLTNVGTATTGASSVTASPEVWSAKLGIGIIF